jgi:hypothetical protein
VVETWMAGTAAVVLDILGVCEVGRGWVVVSELVSDCGSEIGDSRSARFLVMGSL